MNAQHARLVPLAFALVIFLGALALMLPGARAEAGGAPFLIALFTATSAVTVSGLGVVDPAVYWSGFGQFIIYILMQVGGFGVMSGATLFMMMISRKLGLSTQLIIQKEARGIALGDMRQVISFAFIVLISVQTVIASLLTWRFMEAGNPFGKALWFGIFHAASSMTNAGVCIYENSFLPMQFDPAFLLFIMIAIIIGGLGLPVLYDFHKHRFAIRLYSLHSKLTLLGASILILGGFIVTLAFEWNNPATLGAMPLHHKISNALFHSVASRSAGLNSFDTAAIRESTMLLTYLLMFIGGGSASMAGGIKVTTVMVIALAVWAEMRGEQDVTIFNRRLSPGLLREALTILTLAIVIVSLATVILHNLSPLPLRVLVFDILSAFGNVGLSMGATPQLPPSGQIVLMALMFMGRAGTLTIAIGLALRSRQIHYRYPEERPVIG